MLILKKTNEEWGQEANRCVWKIPSSYDAKKKCGKKRETPSILLISRDKREKQATETIETMEGSNSVTQKPCQITDGPTELEQDRYPSRQTKYLK